MLDWHQAMYANNPASTNTRKSIIPSKKIAVSNLFCADRAESSPQSQIAPPIQRRGKIANRRRIGDVWGRQYDMVSVVGYHVLRFTLCLRCYCQFRGLGLPLGLSMDWSTPMAVFTDLSAHDVKV